jgi:hypothetical protein
MIHRVWKIVRDRRADFLAVALIFLVITLLFADVLFFGANFFLRDISIYHYPMKRVVASALASGDLLREWNPLIEAGQPLAANPAYEWFYPPQWLVALLPFNFGFNLHILLHLYVAALGMYLLVRSLPASIGGAIFSSLAFALGGPLLSLTNLLPFLFSYAWLPLTLFFTRRAILRSSRRSGAAAALTFGLQLLVGEPVTAAQTAVLLIGYAVYAAASVKPFGARLLARNVAIIAAIGLGGFSLAVIQLIPAFDFARDTVRAIGFPREAVTRWSFPPLRIGELFFPHLLGPVDNYTQFYWGASLYPTEGAPFLFSIYSGLLVTLLFFAAVKVRSRGASVAAVALLVGLILAAGRHLPFFGLLLDSGLTRSIRYPEKFLLAPLLLVTMVAARGYDEVRNGSAAARRAVIVSAIVISSLAFLLFLSSFLPAYQVTFARLFSIDRNLDVLVRISRVEWLIAAVRAVGVVAVIVMARRWPRYRDLLPIIFLVIEMGRQTNQLIPRAPRDFYDPPPTVAKMSAPAGARLFNQAEWMRNFARKEDLLGGVDSFWVARNSMMAPLAMAWGYGVALADDVDQTQLLYTRQFEQSLPQRFRPEDAQLMEVLMNAAAVDVRLLPRNEREALREVSDISKIEAVTFERRGRVPRFYFPQEIVVTGSGEMSQAAFRAARSPRPAVVSTLPPVSVGEGEVRPLVVEAERIALRTRTTASRLLVISQSWHRYWTATVDGSEKPIVRVNAAFQGIVVPAGEHQIELRYDNPLWPRSAVVSVVALLALLAGVTWPSRRVPAASSSSAA